jgi:hypothetical protein
MSRKSRRACCHAAAFSHAEIPSEKVTRSILRLCLAVANAEKDVFLLSAKILLGVDLIEECLTFVYYMPERISSMNRYEQ